MGRIWRQFTETARRPNCLRVVIRSNQRPGWVIWASVRIEYRLPVTVARPPLRYGTMSEEPPATGDLNSLLGRVAQHDADAFAES